MSAKTYPQFLLLGDSIVQYASFVKDGFSFGAALAERAFSIFILHHHHLFLLSNHPQAQ